MANKELTAKVRLNAEQAHRTLDKLVKKIQLVNNAINKPSGGALEKAMERRLLQQEKIKQATAKTQLAEAKVTTQNYRSNEAKNKALISEEKLNSAKLKTAEAEQRIISATEKANSSTNKLLTTAKNLAKTYLGMKLIKVAITASDTVTSAQNKLNNIEGGNPKQTAESMDKIYAAAQRSRSGYDAMLSNVSKTMMLAGDSFQGNVDNAIRFQEIMSKAYTVGGATAQEQHSSMYQMVQALGAGILAGDELRSVREGAPIAYKEIEKFAQKVHGVSDSLKDMASDGMITSDLVVAAIMNAGDKIEKKFNNTKVTFAQAWTEIKNTAMRAFQPALESLNQMLNSDAGRAIVTGLGTAMVIVGNTISWVVGLLSTVFSWIYNIATGSTTVGKIILTILSIIGVAMAVILFPKFIAWISYLLFAAKYYLYVGAQALAAGIKAAIGWMAANWVLLLIILVIAAVVAAVIWLSDSFADACGMIVGGIMAAVAFVWNLFLSLVDVILGCFSVLWNKIAAFVNFFANVFKDPIGSIIHLFGDLADTVLSILQTIANAIDKVFGSDLGGKIQNWRDSLKGKVEVWAKEKGNGKYEKVMDTVNWSSEDLGLGRWAYSDAYKTGYKWGESAGNWITDKLSNLTSGLPNPTDPAYAVDGAYNPDLSKIAGNTDDIKDSMQLENEDLEYMRKIAEMEWKNEFTTAEIKVDMTNHNQVNSDRDLDGIVEYLSDVLREEMTSVAYGVHY